MKGVILVISVGVATYAATRMGLFGKHEIILFKDESLNDDVYISPGLFGDTIWITAAGETLRTYQFSIRPAVFRRD